MSRIVGNLPLVAILLLTVACESGPKKPGGAPDDGARPKNGAADATEPEEVVPPHERFLVDPTVVKARTITAILPAAYRDEITVKGLSAGWQEEDDRVVWEGTGEVEVKVRNLVLSGPSVTVTLVSGQAEPEVLIQATGDVAFGHRSKGLSTRWEGKAFLMMRNDRWVEH